MVSEERLSTAEAAVSPGDRFVVVHTSGSTAAPKGVLHTTAGYLVGVAATHHYIFDVKPDSVYWCAADVGWVTGHSYIVYAPLMMGVTSILYEGAPDWPDRSRFWDVCERHGVTVVHADPTELRHEGGEVWYQDTCIDVAYRDYEMRDLLELDSQPCESMLVVEFYDNVADGLAELARRKLGLRSTILTESGEMNLVWALRKAGLSLQG